LRLIHIQTMCSTKRLHTLICWLKRYGCEYRTDRRSLMNTQNARLLASAGSQDKDDDESDDVDEDEIEEELGFISPLDTVDPYSTFKSALASS
jgi:hypothetical protein